jgi:urea carboxylase
VSTSTTQEGAPSGVPEGTLYTFGGDEWIVCQLAEAMSVQVNVRAQAITRRLAELALDGVVDICPANAAYMIRIDPDVIHPRDMVARLQELEEEVGDAADVRLDTRIIDIPVLFQDEWTHETLMRFRDRHQTPEKTDIEFAAERNGFPSTDAFIQAMCGAPFIVSMTGFVPDLAWDYQLVPEDRQIEVPKYLRPRTDTPELAFSWGGAFAAIYPVRGAGGYQLLGMCPVPVIDPSQTLPDFREDPFLHRAGDLHRYRAIDHEEFDTIRAQVGEKTYEYTMREVEFVPGEYFADPEGTAAALMELPA